MKAIGGSVRRVVRLFLAEAILMGLSGLVGSAIGLLVSIWLEKRCLAWLRSRAGLCILFLWPSPWLFPLPARFRCGGRQYSSRSVFRGEA